MQIGHGREFGREALKPSDSLGLCTLRESQATILRGGQELSGRPHQRQGLTASTESDFRTAAGGRAETGSGATEGRRQWVRIAGELEVLEFKERGTELGF